MPASQLTEPRPVWIRREVEADQCPKFLINAQSLEWLEQYAAWRSGYLPQASLTAKQIEAFQVLENELFQEAQHAKQSATGDISRSRNGSLG